MNSIFNIKYPQNYIIRYPWRGCLVLSLFLFLFLLLYRPLDVHESDLLNFSGTMAVYSLASAATALIFILVIKNIPYFSRREEWNFRKEAISVIIILTGMGLSVYFLAFLIEPRASRWNAATFFNSLLSTWIVGIIPFAIFTLTNIGYIRQSAYFGTQEEGLPGDDQLLDKKKIYFGSKLKKENLEFYPYELLFVESEGNYVVFHLFSDERVIKKTIRNSISNTEMQLAGIPWIIRTHRAFIVNLKNVRSGKGNSAGYRLKMKSGNLEVPVSRHNTTVFERLYNKYADKPL